MVRATVNGSCSTALIGSRVVGPAGIATVSVLPVDCAMADVSPGNPDAVSGPSSLSDDVTG